MKRPYVRVDSEAPVFDGNEAVCWFVNLTSNIEAMRFKNITPGVLYTFVFYQDAVGGHTVTWPGFIDNPPQISTRKKSVSTANFIGMSEEEISNTTGTITSR